MWLRKGIAGVQAFRACSLNPVRVVLLRVRWLAVGNGETLRMYIEREKLDLATRSSYTHVKQYFWYLP